MSYWGVHYMLAQQEEEHRKELYALLPFLDEQHIIIEPLLNIQTLIEQLHPDWLTPILDSLDRNDLSCITSSLSASQQQLIKLNYPLSIITISPFMKRFIYFILYQKIKEQLNLPASISHLPKHPLNVLTSLSIHKLSLLCFYLSLFDLKTEAATMINVSMLKTIEASLTPKELKFIADLKKNPLKNSTIPELKLSAWSGEINALKEVLINRGTYYLAYALGNCSEALNWRVLHALDKSKSEKVQFWGKKLATIPEDSTLTENILKTIAYINTGVGG